MKKWDDGVSIIFPIHGEALYLEEALESVVAQSLSFEYEVLLALDHPNEDVLRKITEFAHPKFRCVEVTNGGVANAHNAALFEARFAFAAVMHSDDIMLPHRIKHQIEFMNQNPTFVCVGGQIEIIDQQGKTVGQSWFPEDSKLVKATARLRSPVAHPTAMYRTELAIRLGGYRQDCAPAEDFDLWLRMLEHGEIGNLSSFVLKYRRHINQTSQENKFAQSAMFASIASGIQNSTNSNSNHRKRDELLHQSKILKFDEMLHQMAIHRFEQRWKRVFLSLPKLFVTYPKGFVIYSYLFILGRLRLRRIDKAKEDHRRL